jgi:hypothetical protein
MGIVVCVAHFAFDAADMTTQTSVGTSNKTARVRESLVLESLLSVVLLSGGRAIPRCPILAEDVADFAIGSGGGTFVIVG